MHIKEIAIRNFRILSDSKLDLDKKPCLMIGRNNAGKTSFMVLVEKFLRGQGFTFNDFPVHLREKLLNMDMDTDVTDLAIRLMLTIGYEADDDLSVLSEFIVDLEPGTPEVYLLFECRIDKGSLFAAMRQEGETDKQKFIRRHLGEHLKTEIYTFDDSTKVKKSLADVTRLIDFEIIHANRSVVSSEERTGRKVLSQLTTSYYNSQNADPKSSFKEINKLIRDTDKLLDATYGEFFKGFLKSAEDFLDIGTLKIRSNLSAKEILEGATEVVYGDENARLPEHQNGLGHVNILFLLLSIEMKKRSFEQNKKHIRLLFIEEPEAHTHPQLQYNFARKIGDLVGEKQGIQTIITTHSPHIVASHPFENLRYMAAVKIPGADEEKEGFRNVVIKHFHRDLYQAYGAKAEAEFRFLKQYLTIVSAELFFADKAIFIEGTSEALLLPYFISSFDREQREKRAEEGDGAKPYTPLAAQNIAIVEAGANAKAFRHFVEFLGIPTLIITDIDTVYENVTVSKTGKPTTTYPECKVSDARACNTSNATIKYYLGAPDEDIGSPEYQKWFRDMCTCALERVVGNIRIAYQCEEKGFQARSFEDAFIHVNLETMAKKCEKIEGLKNRQKLVKYAAKGPGAFQKIKDIYDLTEEILGGKSGLASSLLYQAYANGVQWQTPKYIREGLEWLQKQTH